jgi:hypothetical protein
MTMTMAAGAGKVGDDGDASTSAPMEGAAHSAQVGNLRDFVLANGPLLGAIGGLIGIATFVNALPLYAAWVQPYLIFLLLAAAVLIWLELLAQWPPELMIYRGPAPSGRPWRLVGFAYVVQLTMVGFVGGFLWRIPRLVTLTLATVIGAGLWHYLVPERSKGWRGSLLATAIVALLVAMLLTSLVHPTYQSVFEALPPNEP